VSHGESLLLIPSALKRQIDQEAREAELRELEAINQAVEAAQADRWAKRPPPQKVPEPVKPKPLDYDQERARLVQQSLDQRELDSQTELRVYDHLAPLTLIKRHASPAPEDKQRGADIYKALAARGPVRRIARGVDDLQDLDELAHTLPHLREVIAFVRSQILLARANLTGLYIPPILLAGDPGVGKTHFAQELAGVLGLPVHLQSMDTDVSNAAFLGSDKKWGNSQMGVLFELIGLGDYANPMVILDELDKASRHNSGGMATQSLHSLLEPVSARTVRDVSLEMEFDASRVIWLATANEPERIAAPLRSRFKQFWIEQPQAADAIQMAQAMVKRLVPELAPDQFKVPGRSFVVQLAHLSAREIHQVLREAIGKAVVNERLHLEQDDLPAELRVSGAGKVWLH